jgi:hypothetical protein
MSPRPWLISTAGDNELGIVSKRRPQKREPPRASGVRFNGSSYPKACHKSKGNYPSIDREDIEIDKLHTHPEEPKCPKNHEKPWRRDMLVQQGCNHPDTEKKIDSGKGVMRGRGIEPREAQQKPRGHDDPENTLATIVCQSVKLSFIFLVNVHHQEA